MKQFGKMNIWIVSLLVFSILISACSSGPSAQEYVNQGLASYEDGDVEQAIENYTKAIELYPNFVGAYFNRGIAYQASKNNEQAIEDFAT